MGDFNEVRFASKRYGTIFHVSHTDIFNSFITDSHFIDVPLGGYSFTWSNKHASKMGKLDRESYMDYSPTPFRLFHSWFLENDFVSVVKDSWNNVVVHDLNAMVFLKNKLKIFKHKLKACSCQKRSNREFDRKELHDKLIDIDSCLNKGEGADIGDRKMTWVCWKKVMVQKQYGRYLARRHQSYSCSNGALNQPLPHRLGCSVWNMVRKAIGNLKSKNVDLMEFCKKVIGNGYNTSF
uniref:RNA-directed DNA polymerase, eukaryota n=1 Tax=Tanacetum cinerariifolium TaxID=118510 RepID=A0A6L2JSE4_TANCI|nr:hypothetical protein [Tanacetum cinerariifolium]